MISKWKLLGIEGGRLFSVYDGRRIKRSYGQHIPCVRASLLKVRTHKKEAIGTK
jgi:hypothetical protein